MFIANVLNPCVLITAAHLRSAMKTIPVFFFQHCKHQHFTDCEDCQSLKIKLKELEDALKGMSWTPYSKDHQQDLMYDFECAQNGIF